MSGNALFWLGVGIFWATVYKDWRMSLAYFVTVAIFFYALPKYIRHRAALKEREQQ